MAKKMGRPPSIQNAVVVSVRMEKEMYNMLYDISALETINSGRPVSIQELIRHSLEYVYSDNERLRECFRRNRAHMKRRFQQIT